MERTAESNDEYQKQPSKPGKQRRLEPSRQLSRTILCTLLGTSFLLGAGLTLVILQLTSVNRQEHIRCKGSNDTLASSAVLGELSCTTQWCTMVYVPAKDGVWQVVTETPFHFSVYSAFYDSRGETMGRKRVVRVIGTSPPLKESYKMWCLLWFPSKRLVTKVEAKIKIFKELPFYVTAWKGRLFVGYFIICPLDKGTEVPHSVSIVTENQTIPNNRLLVVSGDAIGKASRGKRNLGACLNLFFGNYNKPLQLIEFVEMYQILGIEHFIFYDKSMSNVTACVVKQYVSEGRATLMDFHHNLTRKQVPYDNQNSAIIDCLYRFMYNFSHIAVLDLDDIIIPTHNDTIPQLLKWVEEKNNNSYNAIGFMNSHFILQFPDDPTFQNSNDPIERSLTFLLKTTRTVIQNQQDRPKSIVRPEFVVDVGQHRVHEFVNDSISNVMIEESEAFYHHYRLANPEDLPQLKKHTVRDRSAFRYKDRLTAAVRNRWMKMQEICGLGDIEEEKFRMYQPGDPDSFKNVTTYRQLYESYNKILEAALAIKNRTSTIMSDKS